MKKPEKYHTIILSEDSLHRLDTLHPLIRDHDCIDCKTLESSHHYYLQAEAYIQPHFVGTVKILIPHHFVTMVVLDEPKKLMGFGFAEENSPPSSTDHSSEADDLNIQKQDS